MRVEELMEKLKEFDRQDIVTVSTRDDSTYRNIVVIKESTSTVTIRG